MGSTQSTLDGKIKQSNKDIKKLNKEINKFYDQMYKHHKLILAKGKQDALIDTHKQQKLDVLNKHEIQDQILQGIIDHYEKDKAESDTKDKEVIIYKGCNVIIRKGDLTEEREDAIINPANEKLDHAGGVAKAIVSKGGEVIQKESEEYIKKYGSLPTGEATTTNAGDLL